MGTKYTEVTVSGYNTSPPSDDGSATAANQVSWAKHKDKLTDPIKTALDTMDDRIAADTDTTVVNTSSSGSIGASYHRKTVTVSGASTLTLDNAATLGDGFYVTVVNVDSSNLPIINTTSSEAIDGGTSFTFSKQYEAVKLFCNGSQFYVIGAAKEVDPVMTGDGVLAPHKNLVVKYVTAATVDIDADEVLLTDGTNFLKASSVNETVDISAGVGAANQLDTGAEANSTWYYLWVISDGTNTDCVISASSSAPTLAWGSYTYYGLVGAVYNDAAGDFAWFYQENNYVNCDKTNILTDGSSTSYTSTLTVALNTVVPSIAKCVFGSIGVEDTTADNGATLRVSPTNNVANRGEQFVNKIGSTGNAAVKQYCNFRLVLITDQTLYYKVDGATDRGNIDITGWEY